MVKRERRGCGQAVGWCEPEGRESEGKPVHGRQGQSARSPREEERRPGEQTRSGRGEGKAEAKVQAEDVGEADFRLKTAQPKSAQLAGNFKVLKAKITQEIKNDEQPNIEESRALKPSVHLSANLEVGPLAALPGRSPAFLPSQQPSEHLTPLLEAEKDGPVFYYGSYAEVLFANQDLGYQP